MASIKNKIKLVYMKMEEIEKTKCNASERHLRDQIVLVENGSHDSIVANKYHKYKTI